MARTPLFRKLALALQKARRENLKAQDLPDPIPADAKGWSRRKFIKATAAAGLAGLAEGCLSFPSFAAGAQTPKIAVIGAGLAGLNAAYQLKKAGVHATVYEARQRVGGRVLSGVFDDGLVVDLGAELINTDHADMLALAREFNIPLFDRLEDVKHLSAPKEAYFFNGVSYSDSELAEDLRLLAGQITVDARLLDRDWDVYAPPLDQLSVADYLDLHSGKIGRPYVRTLIENVIRTEYGAEPHESSALQLIFVLPVINGQTVELLGYSDEVYSVIGGSGKIPDALNEALAGQIHTGKRLTGIAAKNSGYQLTFAGNTKVEADLVIIAIPFPVLNGITLELPLPDPLRAFIGEAKLGSNEKVIAGFSERFWRQDSGFSLAAWSDLGFAEVWDETSRQHDINKGALNFFLGGDQAREAAKVRNPDNLGKQFISALDTFIPGAQAAGNNTFIKSGWTRSAETLGGYANYKPGQLTRFGDYFWIESPNPADRQQVSAGNVIFIGEHLSDEYYGFMNGAAQTGRLAAELILERL